MSNSIFFKTLCVLIALNITCFVSVKAQEYSDTLFKYFVGVEEPDSDWKMNDFDDSSWEIGSYGVGYGDNDDHTLIDTTISVYTRIQFVVENKNELKDLVLKIDFDDAFAAYINGVEIARVNLGVHGSEIKYNQLADRSHEAQIYRGLRSPVLGYFVADSIVDKYVVSGNNTLAIEVHNDSIDGSDLTLKPSLHNIVNYNMYDSRSRFKQSLELDSTHLPIFIIESSEFGIPVKRIEVEANLKVISNKVGKYNKPDDKPTEYDGRISIEVRGESSADFPKRSYDFETQDKDGNDTSIALLGLPKENDWILQGPFADKSQIRNALIYNLGRKAGSWHPRVKFCELILNGEFIGLYTLIEKIKRDSSRVYVAKLKSDEISGDNLTGGYIFKFDKGSNSIQIVYPKNKDLVQEQIDYIRTRWSEYIAVLNSKDGLDPIIGYPKYINYQSLIDYIILAELGKNCDSYLFSSYMFKDIDSRNDKFQFGPLWDFDLCFGNAFWQEGNKIDKWQFDYYRNNKFGIKRLFEDPQLVDLFEDRWVELRNSYLHTDSLHRKIDLMVDTLADPIFRNYQVWPVIDKNLFTNVYNVKNHKQEITHIKEWITNRTIWMDNTIPNIYYEETKYPSSVDFWGADLVTKEIYPNPFSDNLTIKLEQNSSALISIRLIAMDGKTIEIIGDTYIPDGEYYVNWQASQQMNNGLYILELSRNGVPIEQYKVIKLEAF